MLREQGLHLGQGGLRRHRHMVAGGQLSTQTTPLVGEPPRDLAEGEDIGDTLPGKLAAKLEKLALI